MNQSNSKPVKIDAETTKLLDYSKMLFESSDGLFDITSGVLRTIWPINGQAKPPSQKAIDDILTNIGFERISFDNNQFTMPAKMQIDFGGIGKEYAVDRVTAMLDEECRPTKTAFLVNFGGDINARKYNINDKPWSIGIEDNIKNLKQNESAKLISISEGGVATSGNSQRYFFYNNQRYGHLLNPITGHPVIGAPLCVTTFANSCTIAGSYSSLAMLQGKEAETFLNEQNIKNVCVWA